MSTLENLTASTTLQHRPSHAPLNQQLWGQAPSARYEQLAKPFRPIFDEIKKELQQREQKHILPIAQLEWLKEAGFTRLRLAEKDGGLNVTLPELFSLLIELAQADANLPQILRIHFGFTEDVVLSQDQAFKTLWTQRIKQGETIGSAWSEGGNASIEQFSTQLTLKDHQLILNGKKFYTTGCLYADWLHVGVTDLSGESATALIPRHAQGVEILDDWNGFGQVLTASGTAIFTNVVLQPHDLRSGDSQFKYSTAFYQLIQLAIITGLLRSATYELSNLVQQRSRNYSHANSTHVRHDPQILAIVGKIRSIAYTATTLVEKSAQALQRAHDAVNSTFNHHDENFEADQHAIAELEVAQAQSIITDLGLHASSLLFDALGASATDKNLALDRYWRNIRTLSSHNPRIFKDRIIGDFSVNGTLPPEQWRIGQTSSR